MAIKIQSNRTGEKRYLRNEEVINYLSKNQGVGWSDVGSNIHRVLTEILFKYWKSIPVLEQSLIRYHNPMLFNWNQRFPE